MIILRVCTHLDVCKINGTEYDHNEDIIHPDPCMKCKCKVSSTFET